MSAGDDRDARRVVREGYDRIAERYAAQRDRFENDRYVQRFVDLMPPPASVLDVGCGSGVPVARSLAERGYDVHGIDVSAEQIRLARESVPNATFEVRDMRELEPGDHELDAFVSFYAIFHIPRTQHRALLEKLFAFVRPGGLGLLTMGASDWEGTEPDFHGAEMFWSHYGPEKNRELVREAGFVIGFDEIHDLGDERHHVLIVRRAS